MTTAPEPTRETQIEADLREIGMFLDDAEHFELADDSTVDIGPALEAFKRIRSIARQAPAREGAPAVQEIKHQLFALCEDTIDKYHEIANRLEDKQGAFARGRIIEAKSTRDAMAEVFRSPLPASPAAPSPTEAVAQWMLARGYATGHGDAVEDLLDELDWQARDRGAEEAAKIARDGCLVPPDGGSPTEEERQMCEGIATAIRARKRSQQ